MMHAMSDADRIWERAVTAGGGAAPGKGDRHLSAALELHFQVPMTMSETDLRAAR